MLECAPGFSFRFDFRSFHFFSALILDDEPSAAKAAAAAVAVVILVSFSIYTHFPFVRCSLFRLILIFERFFMAVFNGTGN